MPLSPAVPYFTLTAQYSTLFSSGPPGDPFPLHGIAQTIRRINLRRCTKIGGGGGTRLLVYSTYLLTVDDLLHNNRDCLLQYSAEKDNNPPCRTLVGLPPLILPKMDINLSSPAHTAAPQNFPVPSPDLAVDSRNPGSSAPCRNTSQFCSQSQVLLAPVPSERHSSAQGLPWKRVVVRMHVVCKSYLQSSLGGFRCPIYPSAPAAKPCLF